MLFMPKPKLYLTLLSRREGDSNPRYRFQYGSLANYWYKPLTHLSWMCKNGSLAVWECKYSIND